jgi:hypothetical protein
MRISDVTATVRPIDPSYPTNRAIAALTMAVIVGGIVLQLILGAELTQGASWGISAGLAVFLAWALGRELDPDHDLSAFVAAGLALVGLLLFDLPNLMALFWILLLLRMVNRTTGLPARILDSLLILGFGSWLTWQRSWIYGLMTGLAFFLDSRLSPPHRRHLFFAGIALLAMVILYSVSGGMPGEGKPSLLAILAVSGMSVLFVPVIVASHQLSTVGDATGEPLNPRRVQAVQVIALLTGLQIVLWDGDPGVVQLMPVWATVLGVALYKLFGAVYASIPSHSQR